GHEPRRWHLDGGRAKDERRWAKRDERRLWPHGERDAGRGAHRGAAEGGGERRGDRSLDGELRGSRWHAPDGHEPRRWHLDGGRAKDERRWAKRDERRLWPHGERDAGRGAHRGAAEGGGERRGDRSLDGELRGSRWHAPDGHEPRR